MTLSFIKSIFCFLALSAFSCTQVSGMSGDATYYNLGMTACGVVHTDNEMVAAIGFPYWTTANPNVDPMCQKSAWVRDPVSGTTITVQIQDKCQSCGNDNIDLSPTAFQKLRPLDQGRFHVEWGFQ